MTVAGGPLAPVREALSAVEDVDMGDVPLASEAGGASGGDGGGRRPGDDVAAAPDDPGREDDENPPARRCADLPLNDYGNGQRFVIHFGEDLLFVPRVGWFTWTGQFWAVAYHDYLDFLGGPRGTLGGFNFRTNLVSHEVAGFRFTAQDPVNNDADTPDLAVNYNLSLDGGHRVILTASGREVENGDFVGGGAIGSKFMIGPHSLNVNAHYGEGLGAFTGVGVNNSLSSPDVENDDAVSQAGFDVGFRYVINNEWRANVAYTAVEVDDDADTNYEAHRVNLIHNITQDLEAGIEWRKYNLAFGPLLPEGQQVEVMAKYKF